MTGATPDVATRRGVVIATERSAGSVRALADLRARFTGCDVEMVSTRAVGRRARDARKAGAPFVVVAGDDRAIRSAAAELAHGETALIPVPEGGIAGFAQTIGINSLDDAATAAGAAHREAIDLGRVNDQSFVNNANVGVGPSASWRAVARALVAGPRLTIRLDRQLVRAWSVFVGNGCYDVDIRDVEHRDGVDEHLLDVRIVRAAPRFARLRYARTLSRGHVEPLIERRTCGTITIELAGRDTIDVALDGEDTRLSTPLRFESDAGALTVMRP